jgi:hypothetical protein
MDGCSIMDPARGGSPGIKGTASTAAQIASHATADMATIPHGIT